MTGLAEKTRKCIVKTIILVATKGLQHESKSVTSIGDLFYFTARLHGPISLIFDSQLEKSKLVHFNVRKMYTLWKNIT